MTTSVGSLAQKVALVTGAGSGIGRAVAGLLAREGARVALLGRTADELEAVRAGIEKAGGEALVICADVSHADEMDAALTRMQGAWGGLHIVVANAGVNGLWAPLEEITPEEWDRTLSINLRGTYLTVRASLPLLKREGGAIVIISSVNGTRMFSNTGASAYATSKAGQLAFARMMALELAPHRIRINTVCPGAIKTSINDNTEQRDLEQIRIPVEFPAGSVPLAPGVAGTAQQVAQLIAFLVGDNSSHITGAEVFIDGAQSLLQG